MTIAPLVNVFPVASSVRRFAFPPEISERQFEEGPEARGSGLTQFGDDFWPWTAWPWIAALPPDQALVAANTALAMRVRRQSRNSQRARANFREAERLARITEPGASEARAFYGAVALVIAWTARDVVPPVTTAGIISRFDELRTAFYQRWWRLVMRRLAIADVTRAELTVRRTARGVIVRPPILGQLAAALDADFELLAGALAPGEVPPDARTAGEATGAWRCR